MAETKCGETLNDKKFDEIILLKSNVNYSLIGLKSQIDNIINVLINKKDIIYVNSQLKNIILIINNKSEEIKRMNNQLNQIKFNYIKNNIMKEKKINSFNNENICIYNKQGEEINLQHDYNDCKSCWVKKLKKHIQRLKKVYQKKAQKYMLMIKKLNLILNIKLKIQKK